MKKLVSLSSSFNSFLEKVMPILTPLGVVAGIVLGDKIAFLKPTVTWAFASATLLNSMGVSIADFNRAGKEKKAILSFFFSSYVLIPILAFLCSLPFFDNSAVSIGYILLAATPTAVSSIIWAGILHSFMALSVLLLLVSTLLSFFTTPLILTLFSSAQISLDTKGMILSLILMVVLPSVLGVLINTFTKGGCNKSFTPFMRPYSKIAIVYTVVVNTAQVSEKITSGASFTYITQALVAVIFSLLSFVVVWFFLKAVKTEKETALSVVLASAMKNISTALVLAINFLPEEAAIPVIAGIVTQQTVVAFLASFLFN